MINIRNLGSKGSVGAKCKDGICTELYQEVRFESDWYFCNNTESGWFWKELSRSKVPNNHFVKSVLKQPFADVFQNRCLTKISQQKSTCAEDSFLTLQPWKSETLWKKKLQHRCFPVNIAKFSRTVFLKNTSGDCFCKFHKVTVVRHPSFRNQKHNVGCFLLKGLYIFSWILLYIFLLETISRRFCWLTCRNQNLV